VAPLRVQCVSTQKVPSSEDAAIAVLVERAAVLHRVSGGSLLECLPRSPIQGTGGVFAMRCR